MLKHLLAITAFALPTLALAHDFTVGEIVIAHPVAKPTIASAMTGAGYFMITNNGAEDDTLLSVEADFPRVMMHDTAMEDGVATMFHLEGGVVIPSGGSVTFAPGGKHVMFMGLKGDPFEIGEEIPATLTFEKAGTVEINFAVEDIAAMDHS